LQVLGTVEDPDLTMKVVLFLATLLTVNATGQVENAQCALDGAKAASEISDVVVYMWAATSRCQNDGVAPNGNLGSPKCAVDISAALQAINDMVMIVVKAVNDCLDVKTQNYDCGMAIGKLTSGSLGLSKAAANILHFCPKVGVLEHVPTSDAPVPTAIDEGGLTTVGKCVVNAKEAVSNLFAATLEASKIKSECSGSDGISCGRNALHLIAAVGNIGAAVGLGVTHCEGASGRTPPNVDSACMGAVTAAITEIVKTTDAGLRIKQKCTVSNARLFELDNAQQRPQSHSSNTMMVAALVPFFAVISFVAGLKLRRGVKQTRAIHGPGEDEQMLQTDEFVAA
jgi:hypothetical protein